MTKKQTESTNGKIGKEKEKTDKRDKDEKISQTKLKKPSKSPSKTLWNPPEHSKPTKHAKIVASKIMDNATKMSVTMRSKEGKATDAELRKGAETSTPTKTVTSDSSETSETASDLMDDNDVVGKKLKTRNLLLQRQGEAIQKTQIQKTKTPLA